MLDFYFQKVRRGVGFTLYVVGAVVMCVGVLTSFGVEGLKDLEEILRGGKFWQGKN